MMKQMPSPGNSLGGGGGVGGGGGGGGGGAGGLFPPQLSPQQLAMLSNIYPHVQQFHLVSSPLGAQWLTARSVGLSSCGWLLIG